MPHLTGHTQAEAEDMLAQVSLVPGDVKSEARADVPAGQVIAQDFSSGYHADSRERRWGFNRQPWA